MSTFTPGYEGLKRLAAELSVPIPQLLVLARANDPFFAGSPAQVEKAQWFANIFDQCGVTSGVHLRRLHYWLVSQRQAKKLDGQPYQNTEACWNYLCEAGKAARYLNLVAADAFVDRRNPEPHVYITTREEPARPGWEHQVEWEPSLPAIDRDITWALALQPRKPFVTGYDYNPADQPYHVEVWVEKSTMDDVLLPVCEELGLNLVTSLGFQSITGVLSLLSRIAESNKPARILYISDFDPADDGMPVAVARQLEYWRPIYAPDAEVKLEPLALTRDQVEEYDLPRIPVKETDLRRANFEARRGEGAVELDALEALFPGVLARQLRDAVAPYRDVTLARRLRETEDEAQEALEDAWDGAVEDEAEALGELQAEALTIVERYRGDLESLSLRMEEDMAPLKERLGALWQAVQVAAEVLTPDLPPRPDPETDDVDEDAWLLDTSRSYGDQLSVYHERKHG